MTPRSLQAVFRSLADTGPPVPDVELLRRFLAGDEAAFAELVARHGRLVWAVCRSQTRSDADADDAFQATFLVLLKNAGQVRDGGKLSAWLHGVAFKVCGRARRSTQRRAAREQATAHRDGNGTAVPESAWDRALAAVHEEVAKLPETLRVPFVLCCLEGKGQTEAAEQLGWKLGTLSGRLTRAKDAVLAKLDARGLTLGVAAAVGLAVPPAPLLAKAAALAHVGVAVPGSILQLAQGVIGMSMTSVKVLAATVLLACGVGLSVGTGWVATADAQPPAKPAPKADAEADKAALEKKLAEMEAIVRKLQAERGDAAKREAEALKRALDEATRDAVDEKRRIQAIQLEQKLLADILSKTLDVKGKSTAFKTAKWEYDLVDIAKTFNADTFGTFLQERENAGWEFLGSTTLGSNGGVFQWLFRRPVKVVGTTSVYPPAKPGEYKPVADVEFTKPGATVEYKPSVVYRAVVAKPDDAKAIEEQIAALQAKLAGLKAKSAGVTVTFDKSSSPLESGTLATVLGELGEKKFGKGQRMNVSYVNGIVTVFGDPEVIDWATATVKSLGGTVKSPAGR